MTETYGHIGHFLLLQEDICLGSQVAKYLSEGSCFHIKELKPILMRARIYINGNQGFSKLAYHSFGLTAWD